MYFTTKDREVEKIVVHHTGSEVLRDLDSPDLVEMRHILRGFDKIGYDYIIGNGKSRKDDGYVYIGRDGKDEGAHAYGHNFNSLGIALIGNFNYGYPTENQWESLIKLVKEQCDKYRVPLTEVYGHRELGNTDKDCPGRNFDMNKLREDLLIERRKLEKEFLQTYRIGRIVNDSIFK